MAFIAALAPLFAGGLGTAVTVGSTLLGAVGAIGQANAASNAAKQQAQIQRQQADIADSQAASKATEVATRTRQKMAATRAGYLQSGLELTGSPLDVIDAVQTTGKLEELTALYDGTLRAKGLRESADMNERKAKDASSAGFLNAGGTLLTGFSKLYT